MNLKLKLSIIILFFYIVCVEAQERNFAENVTIVRDQWGVPHIYGEKDADVAYGLAWANCEDDFNTIQESVLPAKNMLARWKGKDGAILDFVVQFLGSQKIAKEKYESDLSADYRYYIEAYCKGVNDYAASHPKEIKVKKAFPVTPQDLIATFHYTAALITNAQDPLKNILAGKYDSLKVEFGSNAFAVNGRKTENGNTILVINPHVKYEGMFSWYEAHLQSEEGMNIMGAMFHGGSSVFLGTNQNLGWAHTWNKYDMVDCYKLKMNPNEKLQCELDGQWKNLEPKKAKLSVKLKKWLPAISVKKKFFMSEIGPVIQSKKGEYFAIRWAAMNEIRTGEQWWRMNKANTYDEFYKLLQMNALPRFNIVYADKEQNIFYIDNGIVPKRSGDYDYGNVVPGNTSETVWKEFYKTEELPQVKNPECGHVSNMNNTPYSAACDDESLPKNVGWDKFMNFRVDDNNRSLRFKELIEAKDKVDFNYCKRIKFDTQYPKDGKFIRSISVINTVDANQYPELTSMLKAMQEWDKNARPDSYAATYFLLTFDYVFNKFSYGDDRFLIGIPLDEKLLIEALQSAKTHLLKYFGKLEVPLKDIQVIKRGDEEYPMPGFADALAANYAKKRAKDGKYEGFVGDTYTMIVEYDKNGPIKLETLCNFGSSSHPESKHYTDQLKIWVKQQTKVMTFDRPTILKNAEAVYKPGKRTP